MATPPNSSLALEQNHNLIGKRENYVGYIAVRPRVERIGEHGLFTDVGVPGVLAQGQEDALAPDGFIETVDTVLHTDWSKRYKLARKYLYGSEDTPPNFD